MEIIVAICLAVVGLILILRDRNTKKALAKRLENFMIPQLEKEQDCPLSTTQREAVVKRCWELASKDPTQTLRRIDWMEKQHGKA